MFNQTALQPEFLMTQLRAWHAIGEDIDARALRMLDQGVGSPHMIERARGLVASASALLFTITLRYTHPEGEFDAEAIVESLFALGYREEPLQFSFGRVVDLLALAEGQLLETIRIQLMLSDDALGSITSA